MTHKEVKNLFDYKDGKLMWRVNYRRGVVGEEAGSYDVKGYRRISYKNKTYKTHRLIWLWHYGALPVGDIDHINHQRDDNHIGNLRDVSRKLNQRNIIGGKHGYPGVDWNKQSKKWWARLSTDKGRLYLGQYPTKTEAIKARMAAEKVHGYI